MIEKIESQGKLLGLIVRAEFRKPGIHFFTPNEFSQQVALMSHPKGKCIEPHIHNHIVREVTYTQEVLLIRKGSLRVDFYGEDKNYLESRVLTDGDLILLASGGHGFEILEDVEMFEIKQGPYAGDSDKARFQGVPRDQLKGTGGL